MAQGKKVIFGRDFGYGDFVFGNLKIWIAGEVVLDGEKVFYMNIFRQDGDISEPGVIVWPAENVTMDYPVILQMVYLQGGGASDAITVIEAVFVVTPVPARVATILPSGIYQGTAVPEIALPPSEAAP